jgi:signal transduction histidine kinase
MKLELKIALIGAISKIVIFLVLLIVLEQFFGAIATRHTDRDLSKMKDKTMGIVDKIGIRSFLKEEEDSAYASYNMLKEEYISLNLTGDQASEKPVFATVTREIEGEEFDYRTLTYTFRAGDLNYRLEIGRNIQIISGFQQTVRGISFAIILLVLLMTTLFDLGIFNFLLRPLNKVIIPKLKTTTSPETFDYSELKTSTTDFAYLNRAINDLMRQVTTILSTQRKFTADVSHELMNPLSVIQTKLENLATTPGLPAALAPSMMDIQLQVNRLQQIIKALLLISRIENEQYPKKETFPVAELVEDILSDIGERAVIRNISLENRVDPQVIITGINRSLIRILIFNLVSNAIKYNYEGGTVTIRNTMIDSGLVVEVADNGMGIKPDQVPYIFDRFRRLRTDSSEGFGLGLSIVKTIADFHGISVDVASVEGSGSVFRVIFPLNYVKIS